MEEIISKMSEGYGVLCKTEQAANALMCALNTLGYTWKDGYYLTDRNYWKTFGNATVYQFHRRWDCSIDGVEYGSLQTTIETGRPVVEFSL